MTDTNIDRSFTAQKLFIAPDQAVFNLIESIDVIFKALKIDGSVYKNPSYLSNGPEKASGLTHTYLMPVRIGHKVAIGNCIFYYGRKIHLFPKAYEIVSFEATLNISTFIERRLKETLTDYFSLHSGNDRLDVDIKDGIITSFRKIGFDEEFFYLYKNKAFTMVDLKLIITYLLNGPAGAGA